MHLETVRVLLIEDNPGDAKLITRMLSAAENPRFDVSHVANLRAGLEALKSQNIDVVLLDLGLPQSDGIKTVSQAIAAAPEVPIIVLTGMDTPQAILEVIKAGVRDYFVKSRIEPRLLIEAILRQNARRRELLARPADDAARSPHRAPNRGTDRTVAVLIVEDSPGDLTLIRRMLASATTVRFEIIHASTLSSALRQMQHKTDIVLLDLNLPDSRDLDTLQSMRSHQPSIPIIILTGMEDRGKAVEALAIGAQDYLLKGRVDSQLLVKTILRHVKAPDSDSGTKPGK